MTALLVSLMIGFGATHVHVDRCHRGIWCRGTANAVMPFAASPYSRIRFKAWPPYFQPVIVSPVRAIVKARMVRAQYGDARREF